MLIFLFDGLCAPKVSKLTDALIVEEHVVWLYVSVQELVSMQVLETLNNLLRVSCYEALFVSGAKVELLADLI